jgi:nicotinate-nucleotide adenylyltransferase
MTKSKYQDLEPDLIFFGGSFDPPHLGHVEFLKIIQNRFKNSEIVIVPSYAPVASATKEKPASSEFSDRLAMCVIAFDKCERVQVSAIEESLDIPNYTIDTLMELRSEYPLSKLAWAIGADQLNVFADWKEPTKILELASLVVLPRPHQVQKDLLEEALGLASRLGFTASIDAAEGVILLHGAGAVFVLPEAPRTVSSTDAREKIKSDPSAAKELLSPEVLEYVSELNLYQ